MFSLRSLLLATAVAAVFIVAFLNRSPIWASVIVTMTMLLLAVALVGIYLLPDKRPFLVCAVIVGLVYSAAAFVRPLGLWESLLSTRVLHHLWFNRDVGAAESEEDRSEVFLMLSDDRAMYGTGSNEELRRIWRDFMRTGHCAVALILAVIAGLVGSYVARRRDLNARANHV